MQTKEFKAKTKRNAERAIKREDFFKSKEDEGADIDIDINNGEGFPFNDAFSVVSVSASESPNSEKSRLGSALKECQNMIKI